MPLYQYQALDGAGKKRTGLIEAQDERDAKLKLREQGLMVAALTTKSTVSSKENLKGENLINFTVQLSQLVNAGVPLYQSLVAIEEQYRTEPFHRIILSLCDQIKAGKKLSEAMGAYPQSFDKLYCSMITAGESVGALNIVLDKLSQLLTKQNKLKKQIISAMIYPAVLATFAALVIALLVGFVVPSIEGIFADRQLNTFTEAVLGISRFLRTYWWVYIPAFIVLIAYAVYKLRTPEGKLWLQRTSLKIPLVRTLVVQAAVARFSRTMSTLQIGGLTMIESLRIAREVMGNVVLEDEIQAAENKIIEGSSLSVELANSPWIPRMVSRMLAVGEDSGTTVIMLNKIADNYEDDIEKTLERLMALAQPIILIVMGLVIGSIFLAILLPMTNISAFPV